MNNPLLVDGRNFLDPDGVRAAGITYEAIGRPALADRDPARTKLTMQALILAGARALACGRSPTRCRSRCCRWPGGPTSRT